MAMNLHVFCLDQMNDIEVHEVALVGRSELSRRNLVEFFFHFLDGFSRFQHGVVAEMDLDDVAMAFHVQDAGNLLDPDAAAHEPEDHLGAVPLADVGEGPVHSLVELILRKGLQEIVRRLYGKGIDGKFIARGQEDDFGPAVPVSELLCRVHARKTRHADIEQDNVEHSAMLNGIDEGKGAIEVFIRDEFPLGLKVVFRCFSDELDLFRLVITNCNP